MHEEEKMTEDLIKKIKTLQSQNIKKSRSQKIKNIADKIQKINCNRIVFICTHNSRRSQFAQAWGTVLSNYYGLQYEVHSAGTEKTAVHPRVLDALKAEGMKVTELKQGKYKLSYGKSSGFFLYSKLIDEIDENFIAIMTCDEADKSCPVIPEAEARFRLSYKDPGKYDNTDQAPERYKECSDTIFAELNLLFRTLSNS